MFNNTSYIDKVFGQLIVVANATTDKYGHARFICKCSCGNYTEVLKYNLDNGKTKSCGCLRKSATSKRNKKDLTGKTFGRLFVIREVGKNSRRNILWKCLCKCGTICVVSSNYLLNGDVSSCGCKFKDLRGEYSPHWRGGLSLNGYCSAWADLEFKESIKFRDNYLCQNPYCFKTDSLLHVHHIDYNKHNCHPSNLITVCRACNTRANVCRDWHRHWYSTIMNNKYGYNYVKFD